MTEEPTRQSRRLSGVWERLSIIDKQWYELVFYGFLLAWIVALLVVAWEWSWDNKLIPYVTGVPTILVLLAKLAKIVAPEWYERLTPDFGSESSADDQRAGDDKADEVNELTQAYEEVSEDSTAGRPQTERIAYGVRMTAWSMVLPLLMYVLGFANALVLFTLAFGLRFYESPRRAVVVTVVFSGLMYLFFYLLIGMQPWQGTLGIPSIVDVLGLG
jgi:hypothetical protein